MAQVQLLSMPATGKASSLTTQELREIQECERLVRFRDEVLSGNHPRIKPTHLAVKTVPGGSRSSTTGLTSSAASSFSPPQVPAFHSTTKARPPTSGNRQAVVNPEKPGAPKTSSTEAAPESFPVNASEAVPRLGSLHNGGKAMISSARPFAPSGNTEINPVLLEKSVDLVKAERRLKRQRLERSLLEDADQRRAAAQPSEVLPDFDLADVLSKAQSIVKPTSDDTVANASAASDSFDDNTFYSSQHDTPEFLEEDSRVPNKTPENVDMREESPYEPRLDMEYIPPVAPNVPEANMPKQTESNTPFQNNLPPMGIPTGPRAMSGAEPRQNMPPRIPGLQTVQPLDEHSSRNTAATMSYPMGISNVGGQKIVGQFHLSSVNSAPLGESLERQPSPLIRAHNLSPIAPQPAHVSPLAVARHPAVAQLDESNRIATPAQVAALRKQPSAASSPDGSPRDSGAADKKQKKKKKRKSEKLAAAAETGGAASGSPYIKPEPRSPSPIVAPAYSRPNKRSRQEQRQPQPANDHEGGRFEQRRTYVEERYPPSQQPQFGEDPRSRQAPRAVIDVRYDREYYEPAGPSAGAVYHLPGSPPPSAFPGHCVPGTVHQVRSVSHAVIDRRPSYREAPPITLEYARPRDGRMSVRPVADRERSRSPIAYERHGSVMPPPRAPVRRIIVDEYGREYIEPPRAATVMRASVAPGARLDEPEVVYERALPPVRPMSRRPDVYDDGALYEQPQPQAAPPGGPSYARRVVTQPELAGPDYRAYRERDYAPARSVVRYVDEMPPPPPVSVRPATDDALREYLPPRAASVHPGGGGGGVGYQRRIVEEVPRDYGPVRAGSVRPPVEGQRYEVRHHGYERVSQYNGAGEFAPQQPYGDVYARNLSEIGRASVRPVVARERAPSGMQLPGHTSAGRAEMLPPPPGGARRAYSVRPADAVPPLEYYQQAYRPSDGYYRQAQGPGQGEEVMYVD